MTIKRFTFILMVAFMFLFNMCLHTTIILTGLFWLYGLAGKQALDYRIEQVMMQRIQLPNMLQKGRKVYLIKFRLRPHHYKFKYGKLNNYGDHIEGGCSDSIIDICIESDSKINLNKYLGKLALANGDDFEAIDLFEDNTLWWNSCTAYFCNMDTIQNLLQSGINNMDYFKYQEYDGPPRFLGYSDLNALISMPDSTLMPKYIIVRFKNKELSAAVVDTATQESSINKLVYKDSKGIEHILKSSNLEIYLNSVRQNSQSQR